MFIRGRPWSFVVVRGHSWSSSVVCGRSWSSCVVLYCLVSSSVYCRPWSSGVIWCLVSSGVESRLESSCIVWCHLVFIVVQSPDFEGSRLQVLSKLDIQHLIRGDNSCIPSVIDIIFVI